MTMLRFLSDGSFMVATRLNIKTVGIKISNTRNIALKCPVSNSDKNISKITRVTIFVIKIDTVE